MQRRFTNENQSIHEPHVGIEVDLVRAMIPTGLLVPNVGIEAAYLPGRLASDPIEILG
jgi:hypothetical protein